jgi:hypothetical protein
MLLGPRWQSRKVVAMVAVQSIPGLGELTVEQAERWVAAALAEARALRAYDEQMYPRDADPSSLAAANEVHAAWARWADAAEGLEGRVRPLEKMRRHVLGFIDLGHEIGRIRARLQVTPQSVLDDREEIRQGKTISHEEVRREFRHRVTRARAASV